MQTKKSVNIEISDEGVTRFYVAADTEADTKAGFRLLERVVPEIRALDSAIRAQGSRGR